MTNTIVPPRSEITTEYITVPLLTDAVALFLAHRRNAGLSVDTLKLYTRQLDTWCAWRADRHYGTLLADITVDELRTYITYLQDEHSAHQENSYRPAIEGTRLAPATVASIWRTLRALWNFLIDEGLLSDTQALYFLRKRIPAPKVPAQIRKTYDRDTFSALLSAADRGRGPEDSRRDRAILLLLYDTGMRVAELCALLDDDMNYGERQAVVTGKGNKQRYVFWTARTSTALLHYIAVRGDDSGPLFRGHNSKNSGNALKADGVRQILDRLAKRAGIDLVDGAPVHAIRHTFAHRFLDNGGDGLHLQQLLGHQDISTTSRYVKENPTGLRRAYRKALDDE